MAQDRELKIHLLEVFAASPTCKTPIEVISFSQTAHDWIMQEGVFAPKQSTPDSSAGCESKPEDATNDDEITIEFHQLPLSHILHELLRVKSKQSKDLQFPDLLSALPKEDREAIKKNMQAFVSSL